MQNSKNKHFAGFLSHTSICLATWFGTGFIPKAPGTWGTLFSLPFAWMMHSYLEWQFFLLATIFIFFAGIWASNCCANLFGGDDPGSIVIDEVAGMWMTLVPVSFLVPYDPQIITYFTAFILFRLVDIFKPWPVSSIDKHIKGGIGIMLDDIVASIYSTICLLSFLLFQGY